MELPLLPPPRLQPLAGLQGAPGQRLGGLPRKRRVNEEFVREALAPTPLLARRGVARACNSRRSALLLLLLLTGLLKAKAQGREEKERKKRGSEKESARVPL